MSLFPPGGNGMMMVMGRVGYDPITGIAGCCARAASGHAAAELPRSAMNSRRLMGLTPRPRITGQL
jgi:hypothetical protein